MALGQYSLMESLKRGEIFVIFDSVTSVGYIISLGFFFSLKHEASISEACVLEILLGVLSFTVISRIVTVVQGSNFSDGALVVKGHVLLFTILERSVA